MEGSHKRQVTMVTDFKPDCFRRNLQQEPCAAIFRDRLNPPGSNGDVSRQHKEACDI